MKKFHDGLIFTVYLLARPHLDTCNHCSIFFLLLLYFESDVQTTRSATIISDNCVNHLFHKGFSLPSADVHTTWESQSVANTLKRQQVEWTDVDYTPSALGPSWCPPACPPASSHSGAVLMLRKHRGADNRDQRTVNTQSDLVCARVQFG